MNNSDNMMSLFDYLHRAAGDQLGLEVATAAAKKGIPVSTRYVETKTYNGVVNLYPKSFLDEYFSGAKKPVVADSVRPNDNRRLLTENDDLPF